MRSKSGPFIHILKPRILQAIEMPDDVARTLDRLTSSEGHV